MPRHLPFECIFDVSVYMQKRPFSFFLMTIYGRGKYFFEMGSRGRGWRVERWLIQTCACQALRRARVNFLSNLIVSVTDSLQLWLARQVGLWLVEKVGWNTLGVRCREIVVKMTPKHAPSELFSWRPSVLKLVNFPFFCVSHTIFIRIKLHKMIANDVFQKRELVYWINSPSKKF